MITVEVFLYICLKFPSYFHCTITNANGIGIRIPITFHHMYPMEDAAFFLAFATTLSSAILLVSFFKFQFFSSKFLSSFHIPPYQHQHNWNAKLFIQILNEIVCTRHATPAFLLAFATLNVPKHNKQINTNNKQTTKKKTKKQTNSMIFWSNKMREQFAKPPTKLQ